MSDDKVVLALSKAAEYVAIAQPMLDKYEQAEREWAKKAHTTAHLLISRGLLDPDKASTFIEKVSADHTFALSYLDRITKQMSTPDLGNAALIPKQANYEGIDPFVRLLVPEITNHSRTGMIN